MKLKKVVEAAHELSNEERCELRELLDELDDDETPEHKAACLEILEQRIRDQEAGKTKPYTREEARRKLREHIQKRAQDAAARD